MNYESRINQDSIKSFTQLNAWKEGHKLVIEVYGITKKFPRDELFGLCAQIKRSAASVTSNIAEGFSRPSYKEKVKFYCISLGSLTEVQDQLLIARDVGYIDEKNFIELAQLSVTVHKITNGLIKKSKCYYN